MAKESVGDAPSMPSCVSEGELDTVAVFVGPRD